MTITESRLLIRTLRRMVYAMGRLLRESEYLTAQEAADELRITVRTLRKWAATGTGPKRMNLGSRIRYSRADLRQYMESRYAR